MPLSNPSKQGRDVMGAKWRKPKGKGKKEAAFYLRVLKSISTHSNATLPLPVTPPATIPGLEGDRVHTLAFSTAKLQEFQTRIEREKNILRLWEESCLLGNDLDLLIKRKSLIENEIEAYSIIFPLLPLVNDERSDATGSTPRGQGPDPGNSLKGLQGKTSALEKKNIH